MQKKLELQFCEHKINFVLCFTNSNSSRMNEWMNEWKFIYLKSVITFINDKCDWIECNGYCTFNMDKSVQNWKIIIVTNKDCVQVIFVKSISLCVQHFCTACLFPLKFVILCVWPFIFWSLRLRSLNSWLDQTKPKNSRLSQFYMFKVYNNELFNTDA